MPDNTIIYNCSFKSVNKMSLFELFMLSLSNGHSPTPAAYFFPGFGLMKSHDNN